MDELDILRKLLGAEDMKLVNDTALHTNLPGWAFIIRENTVMATCTYLDKDGQTVDFVARRGISGVTLYVTDPLQLIPQDRKIKEISCTSGSIWVVL